MVMAALRKEEDGLILLGFSVVSVPNPTVKKHGAGATHSMERYKLFFFSLTELNHAMVQSCQADVYFCHYPSPSLSHDA